MNTGFKGFVNHLFRSELLKSASILFSGTVIAQAVSLLLQPFLRRFFSPEAFGAFSVYISLVGIIAVVSSLKYDDAIVLPEKDSESVSILGLAIFFSFIINIIVLLAVFIFGKDIVRLLELPEEIGISVLYLVPAGAFLYSASQCINGWLVRKKRYLDISVNKLVRRVSEGTAQVIYALLRSFKGLIYSDIIGQSLNMAASLFLGIRQGLSLKLVDRKSMVSAFREYSDFPKYYMIPSFMSTCSFLLPALMINKFYSTESAGYFDLAKVLLSVPLAFVASSLSNVILQSTSEKYQNKESFFRDLRPVLLIVFGVCVAEVALILPFGVKIFTFLFGNEWEMSGKISKILVWSFALNFVVAAFSSVFISLRRIKVYSLWQLAYFIAIVSLVLFRDLEFTKFLRVYVFIEVLSYASAVVMILVIILDYEKSLRSAS